MCVVVHDRSTGTLVMAHKEEMLKEIEHQLVLGDKGLAEEDKFLLECNFDELVTTNGKQQEYWILAIQVVREVCRLRAAARDTFNAVGAVAPRHDTHHSAVGAVAPRRGVIQSAAGAVAPQQGTHHSAAGVVAPRQGAYRDAAGAVAPRHGTYRGAAGAVAQRHGDTSPRRGRGSMTARDTSQRRRRGTTAG
jgi:hypothetical protein